MSVIDFALKQGQRRAQRQRTGWIGVEIGTAAIKIAQVERIANQYRIARNLILQTSEKEPFDLQSLEEGRVGKEIREALSLHGGFQGRMAACTLSMHFCELRTLVSARGSEEEQRELISLELDDAPVTSASSDSREFDFWDCAHQHEDKQGMTQVHVLSIPRTMSYAIGSNLLDAGLKCQILDGIPFTTVRAVSMNARQVSTGTHGDDPVAVLDWDHSTATLIVSHNGEPLLTRTLRNCGLDRLLVAIGERLKMSSVEAEALLTTYGIENPQTKDRLSGTLQTTITDLTSDILKELVAELEETLTFLKMQFGGLSASKIFLLGAGSCIRNIAARLELQTGLPTVLWELSGHRPDTHQPESDLANAAALSALAWEQ